MYIYLLRIIAVTLLSFSFLNNQIHAKANQTNISQSEIKKLLQDKGGNLNNQVIDKVLTTINCANINNIEHNNVLTIIDYSLPSNQKRFWVFDLNKNKLLAHTYVSHGITAGALLTNKFSNVSNSKAGSLGVFKTGESYRGREGLSMRLAGLEEGFNEHAERRFIVMHGGWYMDEKFIKRYGRPGRSWGCPAVSLHQKNDIINTIKEGSLMVIYYPSDKWFENSKFLNCENIFIKKENNKKYSSLEPTLVENAKRDKILYFDLNGNNIREREDPVITLSADDYEQIFKTKAPLDRMIRRQINDREFIVLSDYEFNDIVIKKNNRALEKIKFIIPVLVKINGRMRTKMKILDYGNIEAINHQHFFNEETGSQAKGYLINFNSNIDPAIQVKPTDEFIRWIGL